MCIELSIILLLCFLCIELHFVSALLCRLEYLCRRITSHNALFVNIMTPLFLLLRRLSSGSYNVPWLILFAVLFLQRWTCCLCFRRGTTRCTYYHRRRRRLDHRGHICRLRRPTTRAAFNPRLAEPHFVLYLASTELGKEA